MTGTSEVCEALDVATRTLSLFFDSADENVRAYEVLRAHRARLERLEAFVEAAMGFIAGQTVETMPTAPIKAKLAKWSEALRHDRARLRREHEAVEKVREHLQAIVAYLGPVVPRCGCQGCEFEMANSLEEARCGIAALGEIGREA